MKEWESQNLISLFPLQLRMQAIKAFISIYVQSFGNNHLRILPWLESQELKYSKPISVIQGTVSPSFLPQRMGAGPKMGTGKRSIGPVWWSGTGGPWKAAYLTASLTPWQNREPDPEGSHDLHKVGVSSTEGGSLLCSLHFWFASP